MRPAWTWIIIDDKKRILLIKRSDYTPSFSWCWTMPAWRWESGEEPRDIVIREVQEEIWLTFIPEKIYQKSIQENAGEKVETFRFLWTWEWKIIIQEEEADWYAWYTYQEIKDLKMAFDYAEVIEKLYNDWLIE